MIVLIERFALGRGVILDCIRLRSYIFEVSVVTKYDFPESVPKLLECLPEHTRTYCECSLVVFAITSKK